MNTKFLLDQLLKSGQTLLREQGGAGSRGIGRQHGRGNPLGDLGGRFGRGIGGGALGSGALALMLGNKRLRKLGGKAAVYGGVAALGVLAYRAYGDWQRQQRGGAVGGVEPRTVDRVSGDEAERHSTAILTAIVAAAKADGHVDERERALIEEEFTQLDDDPALRRWLEAELRKPADPAEVAAAADSGEMAAEMYLASRMMIDDESYMERAYLDELARCLKLDPELRRRLDQEAAGAASG
jgi:uncharacterized membrane protein YebE (DUF533 family)